MSSSPSACPDLEMLFQQLAEGHPDALAHARSCVGCSEILETHRQLEKDLFRLQDPVPPASLLQAVMARVAAEPPPVRFDLGSGAWVMALALAASAFAFVLGGANLSHAGSAFAALTVSANSSVPALTRALVSVWQVAALPISFASLLVVCFSLLGLRRLDGPLETAKVP